MDQNLIRLWRFYDAPPDLQALSENGGDEDWLMVVPPVLANMYIPWAEQGGSFGCCSVDRYILDDGSMVYIGAHS